MFKLNHFKYNRVIGIDFTRGPDYWLVAISALPFGTFGEMLGADTTPATPGTFCGECVFLITICIFVPTTDFTCVCVCVCVCVCLRVSVSV